MDDQDRGSSSPSRSGAVAGPARGRRAARPEHLWRGRGRRGAPCRAAGAGNAAWLAAGACGAAYALWAMAQALRCGRTSSGATCRRGRKPPWYSPVLPSPGWPPPHGRTLRAVQPAESAGPSGAGRCWSTSPARSSTSAGAGPARNQPPDGKPGQISDRIAGGRRRRVNTGGYHGPGRRAGWGCCLQRP